MDHKRTTLLSLVFVFVGMMFLVSATAEKALAIIHAAASGDCGPVGASHKCLLTFVEKKLDSCAGSPCGVWTKDPTQQGTEVTWATKGDPQFFPFGVEAGRVIYSVDGGKGGTLEYGFFNGKPFRDNSCSITHNGPGQLTFHQCFAEQSLSATFTYGTRIEGLATSGTGSSGSSSGHANGGDANDGQGDSGDEGDNN